MLPSFLFRTDVMVTSQSMLPSFTYKTLVEGCVCACVRVCVCVCVCMYVCLNASIWCKKKTYRSLKLSRFKCICFLSS